MLIHEPIVLFEKEYAWLSNFFPAIVTYDGMTYPTVEHAFQAAKTLDMEKRKEIAAAITPGRAKRMGRQVELRSDWEKIKVNVMAELLKEKFKHKDLREKLLATENAYLEEGNYWHDNFWGNCDGNGANWLGILLMQERERIRESGDEDELCDA